MTLATLDSNAVISARVSLGRWGMWHASLDLAEDVELSGTVSLEIGGLACTCTVLSGGPFDGRAGYYVAGGAGGWGKTVEAKGYVNDAGVKVSKVLGDVAQTVGETITDLPATRQGPHYARANSSAFRTLNQLAPQNWHVDLEGVTHFGVWPESTYSGDAPRLNRNPEAGVLDIATEDLTGLVPGVVVDGLPAATDVEWVLTPDRLTARVYYAAQEESRRLAAYRKIVEALYPNLKYLAPYEFRVVSQNGDRFELQPARNSSGLPSLSNVAYRPGVAGAKHDVKLGELVVVQFLDGDPSRPVVTNHDAPDNPGWVPKNLTFGGPVALPVARQTDPVTAGAFAGTITTGSANVNSY